MDIANANINLNIPQPETPFHKSKEGKLSQYCIFPEVNMLKVHLLKMLHFVMNNINVLLQVGFYRASIFTYFTFE